MNLAKGILLKTHIHMCTHICIQSNKHYTTHNIEKIIYNRNVLILFLPMEINTKLILMLLPQSLNNQQIQIKNKIKLEKKIIESTIFYISYFLAKIFKLLDYFINRTEFLFIKKIPSGDSKSKKSEI